MSTKILFIFEGENTEKSITDNLTKFFVDDNPVVTCAYCTNIYKMYAEISKDEDLDTFSILKDIEVNKTILRDYSRSDFAEIYMFFDYDGHTTNASDKKLNDLLLFFNEETDKGKLYISYPMVESIKHIENIETFENLDVACKEFINYKKMVSVTCMKNLKHFHHYDLHTWKLVITTHLKKMNKVVNGLYEIPIAVVDQLTIFKKQQVNYINLNQTVAVLSAFPIFLHDYYGNDKLMSRII